MKMNIRSYTQHQYEENIIKMCGENTLTPPKRKKCAPARCNKKLKAYINLSDKFIK
jgi:hypothetical protein